MNNSNLSLPNVIDGVTGSHNIVNMWKSFDDKTYLVVITTPQWLTYLDIINTFIMWAQHYVQHVRAPGWYYHMLRKETILY